MKLRNYVLAAAVFAAGALVAGTPPAHAAGKLCRLHISASDLMQYNTKALSAGPGCSRIEVTLTNTGKLPVSVMGHDWVLVKTADLDAVANAGLAAGLANNYQKPGDPRIIASTKLVGAGQSASVTFPASKLKKGVSYSFLCTFPGHNVLMRGVFNYR
ncbi:MAG: azurin [Steroidobacteraceae bacterium]